ncbi:MAG: transposase [Patescibacteria group bacterium]|nr:transposase [Patescibacteria group bacterium]
MRKKPFVEGEFYHIYNRGVEKRSVFLDNSDVERFFLALREFNSKQTTGSLYEKPFIDKRLEKLGYPPINGAKSPLVKFVAYAINPNHYHFLVQPTAEKGIERFMQRLNMGYSKYFNARYKRKGRLWESGFQAKHVDSDEYLLHLSVYINLNHQAHSFGHAVSKLARTSWSEYLGDNAGTICDKSLILSQFGSPKEYREFAEASLQDIVENKFGHEVSKWDKEARLGTEV